MAVRTDKLGRLALVRRAPAGPKLLAALFVIVFTALLPRRPHLAYFIPAGVVLLAWIYTRMPLLLGFRRLLIAEIFIIGIGLLTLLHPAALPIFLSTLLKSNICVLSVVILAWTTPFHEVLRELQRLGLPGIMVTTLALLERYLPVLMGEMRRMRRARSSRTFATGKNRSEWRILTMIAGQLFVRAAVRAERIYLAMCARGWK